jgi:hypothetical protein
VEVIQQAGSERYTTKGKRGWVTLAVGALQCYGFA